MQETQEWDGIGCPKCHGDTEEVDQQPDPENHGLIFSHKCSDCGLEFISKVKQYATWEVD